MKKISIFLSLIIISGALVSLSIGSQSENNAFVSYQVDPQKKMLRFYWKDENGKIYGNIQNLRSQLEKNNQQLVFAMNGGMYTDERSPLGLYIENGKLITALNKKQGKGNFYWQPNGVLYLTKNGRAGICKTGEFVKTSSVLYATQSGPMVLMNGNIHADFKAGSSNLNIRNGVGILPNGELLFVQSKQPVSFYDFAVYFKNAGCSNALYLDGFVSRTYLPQKNWVQTDGDFGVIMGEVLNKH